jgi:hypothetical protein
MRHGRGHGGASGRLPFEVFDFKLEQLGEHGTELRTGHLDATLDAAEVSVVRRNAGGRALFGQVRQGPSAL